MLILFGWGGESLPKLKVFFFESFFEFLVVVFRLAHQIKDPGIKYEQDLVVVLWPASRPDYICAYYALQAGQKQKIAESDPQACELK